MRRDIGMIATGVLITVIAAWVLDAIPDVTTAGALASNIWAYAAIVIRTHIILITVIGLALTVALMTIAAICRERVMGAWAADKVALAAFGFLLSVAGAWLVVQDSHLGALTFLVAGSGIVVVAALQLTRYLRFSSQIR